MNHHVFMYIKDVLISIKIEIYSYNINNIKLNIVHPPEYICYICLFGQYTLFLFTYLVNFSFEWIVTEGQHTYLNIGLNPIYIDDIAKYRNKFSNHHHRLHCNYY